MSEPPSVRVGPAWEGVLEAIVASHTARVGVIGPSDSGKSTFARWLGGALAEAGPTARLDADPGQTRIAPPATIALGREPNADDNPDAVCFIGDTSPARNFLGMAAGAALLTRRAERLDVRYLVLDPPGFMDFPSGHALHLHLARILALDHLVVVDGEAMAPVVRPLRRSPGIRIHELTPSPAVVPRSRATRRAYRDLRFRTALEGSSVFLLPPEIPLHGRIPDRDEDWAGRLVGLLDGEGFLLRLGVIHDRSDGVRIRSRPVDLDRVSSAEIGTVRLEH